MPNTAVQSHFEGRMMIMLIYQFTKLFVQSTLSDTFLSNFKLHHHNQARENSQPNFPETVVEELSISEDLAWCFTVGSGTSLIDSV